MEKWQDMFHAIGTMHVRCTLHLTGGQINGLAPPAPLTIPVDWCVCVYVCVWWAWREGWNGLGRFAGVQIKRINLSAPIRLKSPIYDSIFVMGVPRGD